MTMKTKRVRPSLPSPRPRSFQHIVAGLSWPYLDQPGAIVVLQTIWDPRDKTSKPWFKDVAYVEASHLPTLLRLAAEQHATWQCDEWWGDALNEAVTALLYGDELGCDPVPLAPAPYIEHKDRTTLYLQTLRELLAPDAEKLFFAKGSKLPDKVREYPMAEAKPIERYPALAALCYACSALHLWLQLSYYKPERRGVRGSRSALRAIPRPRNTV